MRKMIVKIEDDVTDEQAVEMLLHVVKRGKISEANGKKHYCWLTQFTDSIVSVFPKYWNDNDSFYISKKIRL